MVDLGNDVILLTSMIASLVLVALVTYAVIGVKGFARIFISALLIVIAVLHYVVLARVASSAEISLLPLFILESTKNGSVLYPDIGQISILLLILAWRKDIAGFIKRKQSQKEMASIGEQESPD